MSSTSSTPANPGGWQAFIIAMQVREWRNRKNLATVLTIASPDKKGAHDDSSSSDVQGLRHDDDARTVPPGADVSPLRSTMQDRQQLPEVQDGKQSGESQVGQPSPDATLIAQARRTLTETPDEGADRSGWDHQAEWDDLERRWKALDDAFRSWAANIKTNAHQHHAGFFAQHAQTERTWHLNRALVTLAEGGHDDDDAVRVLVAHVLDSDVPLMPAIGAGHALGSCNAEQAARVAWLADQLVGDTHLSIVYGDDGTPRLSPGVAA